MLDLFFVFMFIIWVVGSVGSVCINGNVDCFLVFVVEGVGSLLVYNSFLVFEVEGLWMGFIIVVIVVYGVNCNVDDYFEYFMFSF